MKLRHFFRIAIISLLLTGIARGFWINYQEYQENYLTSELCLMVGNYLEVGNLRSAHEGIQGGLNRQGMPNACVSLVDNGRSFSPPCIKNETQLRSTICKAEGNLNVRAQIFYPARSFFGSWFWIISLAVFALGLLLFISLTSFFNEFTAQIGQEIEKRLFAKKNPTPNTLIAKSVSFLLERTGLSKAVTREVSNLEAELRDFELKARHETALRTKKESEIQKSQEYIEKVNQIRHDIRSPLSALFAIKHVMSHDEKVQKTLSGAIQSIEKMVDELSHLEKQEETLKLVIIEVLIEELLLPLKDKFKKSKAVSVFLNYNHENLSPVSLISESFKRIINNLLENAFDAAVLGGEIHLNIFSINGHCHIEVEDNGCGVNPEAAINLFKKGATFGKVGGTGLGLYYAMETLKKWQGSIEYEPQLKGSKFIIQIPLTQVGVQFLGLPDQPQIAVIDDSPETASQLRSVGFDVVAMASNYKEGQKLLQAYLSSSVPILVDQNLGLDQFGTDLIEEFGSRENIFLCTDAFDNPQVIGLARQRSIKIIPKPLCFYLGPEMFLGADPKVELS
jgi:signal transduction histidine kinase